MYLIEVPALIFCWNFYLFKIFEVWIPDYVDRSSNPALTSRYNHRSANVNIVLKPNQHPNLLRHKNLPPWWAQHPAITLLQQSRLADWTIPGSFHGSITLYSLPISPFSNSDYVHMVHYDALPSILIFENADFIWQIFSKNKYGSVQELRSTFGHLKSFKRLAWIWFNWF